MKKRYEALTPDEASEIEALHRDLMKDPGKQETLPPAQARSKKEKRRTELETVSMTQLYEMTFFPKSPVIDGLLFSGTYLFAGSPKIGKSFLMAQIGYHVAMGIPLWDYPVKKGEVLYLALEDDYSRLQERLNRMFGVEAVDGLHFAIQSMTLEDGLILQMEDFIEFHPATRLIIIDTLQKVRDIGNEGYSYSMDYQTIAALKNVSNVHNISVLIVHHTRKMEANDRFEMISGTTALLGAADGAFLLRKKKRTDTEAKLQVLGRDQADQELTLEFDPEKCIWNLTSAEKEIFRKPIEPIILKIAELMKEAERWSGTASELLELISETGLKANILTRKLNVNVSVLYNEFGILFSRDRSSSRREITLIRQKEETAPVQDDDAMTINDGFSRSTPLM